MKLKKIACPSCGFSFKIKKDETDRFYQCPSCKSSLYLEEDKPPVVNINVTIQSSGDYLN